MDVVVITRFHATLQAAQQGPPQSDLWPSQPSSNSSRSSSSRVSTSAVSAAASPSSSEHLGSHRVPALKGLVGDDFRQPLDQQNTALLRALPGLESLARNLMGPAAEQARLGTHEMLQLLVATGAGAGRWQLWLTNRDPGTEYLPNMWGP